MSVHVFHSQPRKTTVRTAGSPAGVTVASCRYLAAGERDDRLSATLRSCCQAGCPCDTSAPEAAMPASSAASIEGGGEGVEGAGEDASERRPCDFR